MRIKKLVIQGFRAFSAPCELDLDADVVIISGANGRGKTSLLDALLWALSGSVPRLTPEDEDVSSIVSVYSVEELARVELHLRDGDKDGDLTVIRSQEGNGGDALSRLRVLKGSEEYKGIEAESVLLRTLWPEAEFSSDSAAAMTRALVRSVYLQQDRMRQFVEADGPKEQFTALSELLGSGRIQELQEAIDRARRNWSRETNSLSMTIKASMDELSSIQAEYSELSDSGSNSAELTLNAWKEWWISVQRIGIDTPIPALESDVAADKIDSAVKALMAMRKTISARIFQAKEILEDVRTKEAEPDLPVLQELRNNLKAATTLKTQAEDALSDAQRAAAERRRDKVTTRERREELATLAQISLDHIEGRCPVCQQEHDIAHTREHLKSLISRSSIQSGNKDDIESVEVVAKRVVEAELAVSEAQRRFDSAIRNHRSRKQWIEERNQRLQELGVEQPTGSEGDGHPSIVERIQAKIVEWENRLADLSELIEAGEAIALDVATSSEQVRKSSLEREIADKRTDVETRQLELKARELSSNQADQILKALEVALEQDITNQLQAVRPLLQGVYARLDPHPTFRTIDLLFKMTRNRGRLQAVIRDPRIEKYDIEPAFMLSSSQINMVALSVFVALNMGIPSTPIDALILDDPLQSLDDINLLGFVDLLKRVRGSRQMIVSTHDRRLAGLLTRKLRPLHENHRTRIVSFEDWSREGPKLKVYDVERDSDLHRLVA